MTLAAALSGCDGIILFADTEESTGYSKRRVEKLGVYDFPNHPFRFGIADATEHGDYSDALRAEMISTLLSIEEYDLGKIQQALSSELAGFYSKHIWPQGSSENRPRTEFLIVVQPYLKEGPQIFHVSETAVNMVGFHERGKSIGIGSDLADYLLDLAVCGDQVDSLDSLITIAVYVAREVRENVRGCGQVERLAVFLRDGELDCVTHTDIAAIEDNLKPMNDTLHTAFSIAAFNGVEDNTEQKLLDTLAGIQERQFKWFENWEKGREERRKYLPFWVNQRL